MRKYSKAYCTACLLYVGFKRKNEYRIQNANLKLMTNHESWRNAYSAGQKKRYKYFFMKQKFQLHMGIARYTNVVTSLSTKRHYYHAFGLSNEVFNFVSYQGSEKLSAKVEMLSPF